jgi:MoaA/NifB/PqqE/SkfB family radical SAM enzyme
MIKDFEKLKIRKVQIDPFGFCNAKCWFCPVRYIPQPEEGSGNMSIELIDKIFSDLINERENPNGVVSKEFNFFTTAHYNEVLLYKNVEQLFQLGRKYKLKTYVLSNGVSLNKNNVDLISEYRDVVIHLGLNIPAFEKELWAKRAGFSESQFDRLVSNVKYAEEKLSYLKSELQIHVNGLEKHMFDNKWIKEGPEYREHNYNIISEHENQVLFAKKMFPGISVHKNYIFDRAGFINNILTNEEFIVNSNRDKKVVGCNNFGDRITEWLHINSSGKTFLCCNDYNFEYVFGDLKTQTVSEIWKSQKHIEVVNKALNSICTKCISAVFKEETKPSSRPFDGLTFSRK